MVKLETWYTPPDSRDFNTSCERWSFYALFLIVIISSVLFLFSLDKAREKILKLLYYIWFFK